MKKRKPAKRDKPAAESQLQSLIKTIQEMGAFIIKEFRAELNDFRLQEKHNWEQQRQFNKEISQKVDFNTTAIQALDARVRYQDDMPERLEHMESQQYAISRRVTALESKK